MTAPAGLLRRLASLAYEGLIVAALLFVAAFLFLLAWPDAAQTSLRPLFQLYLFAVPGAYFTWCWTRSGQTLAMRAWRLRLERAGGGGLPLGQALQRYLLAALPLGLAVVAAIHLRRDPASAMGWAGLLPGLLLLAWALWDRDRQFLHDRLARTRIVRV